MCIICEKLYKLNKIAIGKNYGWHLGVLHIAPLTYMWHVRGIFIVATYMAMAW